MLEGRKEGWANGVSEYPEGQKAGKLARATRVAVVSMGSHLQAPFCGEPAQTRRSGSPVIQRS